MLSSHLEVAAKYPCTIITSDPASEMIQGVMRGAAIHISIYTTDPFFRYPKVGENWIVRRENGSFYLDTILQNPKDDLLLEEINPGDALLNIPGKIHTNVGHSLPRKYTQIVGDGSKKEWTITHNLDETAIQVSAVAATGLRAPITAFTWAPVNVEGIGDTNSLVVNFTVAPASKGAQVILIG